MANYNKNNKANLKHGFHGTRLYYTWKNMRQRCNNPNRKQYKDYGGRGICICDEWNEYINFHNWSLENGYSDNLTIDRIDVNGNYSPQNCRWVDNKIQAQNTRLLRSTNTSKYRGVDFHKHIGKFRARIRDNGKTVELGYFASAIDAAKSYDCYVLINGLESPLNFG